MHSIHSVLHPDYRYPSSKNPYWSKLQSWRGRVYSDNETEEYRGSWRSRFATPAVDSATGSGIDVPLTVEIGCNAGHVIVESATQHPTERFIGIDWKFKPIFRGAEKADKRKLGNLLFFRAHAERLHYMFGEGEIDRLNIYFPDPWPKKSQMKNRYLTAERLRTFQPLLKKGGIFHIKTDHPGYFEWIREAIDSCQDIWKTVELTQNLHQNNPHPELLDFPEVTLFEKLFIKDGIPIQSVVLERR